MHCQAGRWVVYDRRFCLNASAAIIQEWSTTNITIWKLAFPDCLLGGTPYETSGKATYKPSRQHSLGPTPMRTWPVCLEWNETTSPDCSALLANIIIAATDVLTQASQTRIIKPIFACTERRRHLMVHLAAREECLVHCKTTVND